MFKRQTAFFLFQHESAHARLTVWEDQTATVSGLYSRSRGKGFAKVVMQEIIDYADLMGLDLSLNVSSYGPEFGHKFSDRMLVEFYKTFGFTVVEDDALPVLMERPNVVNPYESYCTEHNRQLVFCAYLHTTPIGDHAKVD